MDGINTVTTDRALRDALAAFGGEHATEIVDGLRDLGDLAGSAQARRHGARANANEPRLRTVDRYGTRVDEVEFDPSYHWLMSQAMKHGLHASAWSDPRPHPHLRRAAGYIAWSHVDPGHGCPMTMTYAAVPALQADEALARQWVPRLTGSEYDPQLRDPATKASVLAGMGMTEKQGGSDVRTNVTTATPSGEHYLLSGHKWFTSAPMNDMFLVLAQAPEGLSCFVLPRILPGGERNRIELVRLKEKLGNRSNASSELELRDAVAWRLGPEGAGVRTIIEMVAATRLDCVLGSSALMRRGVSEATWHAGHRSAFGRRLAEQPAMTAVLADLAVESEAATLLGLRLAAAVDAGGAEEDALRRIALPAAKFWVCKRTPTHLAESLEVLGGNGYVEESGMPLLFRESPLNSIWEGSGNVNALDLLRAVQRSPQSVDAWREEVDRAGDSRLVDARDEVLKAMAGLGDPEADQAAARRLSARVAVLLQASLLIRHSTPEVADAFVATRVQGQGGTVLGDLPAGVDAATIVARASSLQR